MFQENFKIENNLNQSYFFIYLFIYTFFLGGGERLCLHGFKHAGARDFNIKNYTRYTGMQVLILSTANLTRRDIEKYDKKIDKKRRGKRGKHEKMKRRNERKKIKIDLETNERKMRETKDK